MVHPALTRWWRRGSEHLVPGRELPAGLGPEAVEIRSRYMQVGEVLAAPLIVTERRSGKAKSHSASPFTMPVIGASPGGGAILKCALTMARKLRGAGRSGTRLTATTGGTARTTWSAASTAMDSWPKSS